jgi:hypothetical protein
MPVQHGSLPLAWDDALAPAFGQGLGAAAPADEILSTVSPADTTLDVHVLKFTASTNDRIYCSVQIPHDLWIPSSGTVTLSPHVHWTFVSEPTNGQTVIWKMGYVLAKIDGVFAAAPTVSTADTYTTTAAAEVRKHIVTEFPDITVAAADLGPSLMILYTLKLDDTSTIAANKVALLAADWHYRKGPVGTNTEYA